MLGSEADATAPGRRDEQLNSYVAAVDRKLKVFRPNQHVIMTFQQLIDLVQGVKAARGLIRQDLLQLVQILFNGWYPAQAGHYPPVSEDDAPSQKSGLGHPTSVL